MTEQEMIADGWRRCAVGQRETQHCGLAEEARAQERQRITAAVEALRDGYWKRLRLSDSHPYASGAMDALALALHAIDGEETSHEG